MPTNTLHILDEKNAKAGATVKHSKPTIDLVPYAINGSTVVVTVTNTDKNIQKNRGVEEVILKLNGVPIVSSAVQTDLQFYGNPTVQKEFTFTLVVGAHTYGDYSATLKYAGSSTLETTADRTLHAASTDNDLQATLIQNAASQSTNTYYEVNVKEARYVEEIRVIYEHGRKTTVYDYKHVAKAVLSGTNLGSTAQLISCNANEEFHIEVKFFNSAKKFISPHHNMHGLVHKSDMKPFAYINNYSGRTADEFYINTFMSVYTPSLAFVEKVELLFTPQYTSSSNVKGRETVLQTIADPKYMKILKRTTGISEGAVGAYRYKFYFTGSTDNVFSTYIYLHQKAHFGGSSSYRKTPHLRKTYSVNMYGGSTDPAILAQIIDPKTISASIHGNGQIVSLTQGHGVTVTGATTPSVRIDVPASLVEAKTSYSIKVKYTTSYVSSFDDVTGIATFKRQTRDDTIWTEDLSAVPITKEQTILIDTKIIETFGYKHSREIRNQIYVDRIASYTDLRCYVGPSRTRQQADRSGFLEGYASAHHIMLGEVIPASFAAAVEVKPGVTQPKVKVEWGFPYTDLATKKEAERFSCSYEYPVVKDLSDVPKGSPGLVPQFYTKAGVLIKPNPKTGNQKIVLGFAESLEVEVKDPRSGDLQKVRLIRHTDKLYHCLEPKDADNRRMQPVTENTHNRQSIAEYNAPMLPRGLTNHFVDDGTGNGYTGYRNYGAVHYSTPTGALPNHFNSLHVQQKEMTQSVTAGVLHVAYCKGDFVIAATKNKPNKSAQGNWFAVVDYADSKYVGITGVLEVEIDEWGLRTPHNVSLTSNLKAVSGHKMAILTIGIDTPASFTDGVLYYKGIGVNASWKKYEIFPHKADKYTLHPGDLTNGEKAVQLGIALDKVAGSYLFQPNFTDTTDFANNGVIGTAPGNIPLVYDHLKVQVSDLVQLVAAVDSVVAQFAETHSVVQATSMLEFVVPYFPVDTAKDTIPTKIIGHGSLALTHPLNVLSGVAPTVVMNKGTVDAWGDYNPPGNPRISINPVLAYDSYLTDTQPYGLAIIQPDGLLMKYDKNLRNFEYTAASSKGVEKGRDSPTFIKSQGIHRIIYVRELIKLVQDFPDYVFNPSNVYTSSCVFTYLVDKDQLVIKLYKDGVEVKGGNVSVKTTFDTVTRTATCEVDFKTMAYSDSGVYRISVSIDLGNAHPDAEEIALKGIAYDTNGLMVVKHDVFPPSLQVKIDNIFDKGTGRTSQAKVQAICSQVVEVVTGLTAAELPVKVSLRVIKPLGSVFIYASNESKLKSVQLSFNELDTVIQSHDEFLTDIAHEVGHAITNLEGAFGYGPFYPHGLRFLQNVLICRHVLGVLGKKASKAYGNAYGFQVLGRGKDTTASAEPSLTEDGYGLDHAVQKSYGMGLIQPKTEMGNIGNATSAEKAQWLAVPNIFNKKTTTLVEMINKDHNVHISSKLDDPDMNTFYYKKELFTAANAPTPDMVGHIKPCKVRFKLTPSMVGGKREIEYLAVIWTRNGVMQGKRLFEQRPVSNTILNMPAVGVSTGQVHQVAGKSFRTYVEPELHTRIVNNTVSSMEPTGFTDTVRFINQPAPGVEYPATDLEHSIDIIDLAAGKEVAVYAQIVTNIGVQYTEFVFCRPDVPKHVELDVTPKLKIIGTRLEDVNEHIGLMTATVFQKNHAWVRSHVSATTGIISQSPLWSIDYGTDWVNIFRTSRIVSGKPTSLGKLFALTTDLNRGALTPYEVKLFFDPHAKIYAPSDTAHKNPLDPVLNSAVRYEVSFKGDHMTDTPKMSMAVDRASRDNAINKAFAAMPKDVFTSTKAEYDSSKLITVYTIPVDNSMHLAASKMHYFFPDIKKDADAALNITRQIIDSNGHPADDTDYMYMAPLRSKDTGGPTAIFTPTLRYEKTGWQAYKDVVDDQKIGIPTGVIDNLDHKHPLYATVVKK